MSAMTADIRALIAARPADQLEDMHAGAERVLVASAALAETGQSVVSALMPGEPVLEAWAHYPAQDIRDPETGVQVYYHSHPEHDRGEGEHGHFHVFAPAGAGGERSAKGNGHLPASGPNLCHLVGISMDANSHPIGLFTTNRWVTGEVWLPADQVIARVRAFEMESDQPYAHTRDWLAGMIRLFRPQIETLIAERDACIAAWRAQRSEDVFEDRTLNRPSAARIDLAAQITAIEEALGISQTA